MIVKMIQLLPNVLHLHMYRVWRWHHTRLSRRTHRTHGTTHLTSMLHHWTHHTSRLIWMRMTHLCPRRKRTTRSHRHARINTRRHRSPHTWGVGTYRNTIWTSGWMTIRLMHGAMRHGHTGVKIHGTWRTLRPRTLRHTRRTLGNTRGSL